MQKLSDFRNFPFSRADLLLTYDANDNVTEIVYPSGRHINYIYSKKIPVQVTSIYDDDNLWKIDSIMYYASGTDTGLVKSFHDLNGVTTSLTYVPRNMISTIVSSPSVLNLTYTYDAAGNLFTFTDNLNPVLFTDSTTGNTYKYDSTYRLASVTGTATAGFTYDYAGDVVTKTANGSSYTYQYDLFRNLTGISQSPGGNLATFSYDGDGKRISKLSGGVRTIYHYDKEGRLLSESDANGNAICDYIYLGKNIVGRMDGAPPASTGIYYYHTDPAGTPLAVTGSNGAVVWRGYYEPFGNEYAIQGTIGNDIRFAGNMKDDETGLNYFGARYLDSTLGRFHAPDPVAPVDAKTGKVNGTILAEPQRLNPYAYGLNGPGRYVDEKGSWALAINVGGAVGGIVHPLGDNIYVGGAVGRYFGTSEDGHGIEKGSLFSYEHTTKSLNPLERSSEDGNYYGWTMSLVGASLSISPYKNVSDFDSRSETYGLQLGAFGVSISTSGFMTFDIASRGVGWGFFHLYSDQKRMPTISYPKTPEHVNQNETQ